MGGNSSGGGGGSSHVTPTVTVTPAASSITTAQSLAVSIAVTGSSGTPTGSVVLSSGSYASAAATLTAGSASITIPAGSLAAGSATLTATYTPDNPGASVYNSASGTATGILHPHIVSGTSPVTLTSAAFDAYEGAAACYGTLTLTNATISASTPAIVTVNPGSTPGFCHYTVTGNDGTATQTEGGWIVVGKPGGTLTVYSGNNQSGDAGTALPQALSAALDPGQSGGSNRGAGIPFTTSAGTLSNSAISRTSVIAQTNSSGVASVTLTLPSTKEIVTVTGQDQFALGGASVTFTEAAN
jgi:hypothetical protein